MGWVTTVSIIIALTQGVFAGLGKAGAPQEILDGLQAALTALTKVHGSLVTKAQVDAYTLDYKW